MARELEVPVTTLKDFMSRKSRRHLFDGNARTSSGRPSEVEMLRDEVRRLRSATNKQTKRDVAEERILGAIEEAVNAVAPQAGEALTAPEPDPQAHHRHLAIWSDWHGGEVVDRDAVGGLGSYSWEIQEERVQELLRAMLSHKRRSPELTGLDIVLGGDMCSGANHEELAVTNQYPLAEQGIKMGYLIGRSIEALVPFYPEIRVIAVPGNHPRLTKLPAAKNVHDNMDWVAAIVAQQYLDRCDTVTFNVPRAASVFHEIAGQTLYIWHGDGIRSSMPGVPWGGVMRRVNGLRSSYGHKRIDGFVLGHYHQANVMADLGIYMNGSLKGTDEWSLKSFGSASRPCQLLLEFDEKRERLASTKFLTPTAGL